MTSKPCPVRNKIYITLSHSVYVECSFAPKKPKRHHSHINKTRCFFIHSLKSMSNKYISLKNRIKFVSCRRVRFAVGARSAREPHHSLCDWKCQSKKKKRYPKYYSYLSNRFAIIHHPMPYFFYYYLLRRYEHWRAFLCSLQSVPE